MACDMDLKEMKEAISPARENLLKEVEGAEGLEMSLFRTCADVSLFLPKESEHEKDEIVLEKHFSLQSRVFVTQDYCAGETAETLAQFQNHVAEQSLRAPMGYDAKTKFGSYMEGTTMPITRLDGGVVTIVCCLVKKKRVEDTVRKRPLTRTRKWWRPLQSN